MIKNWLEDNAVCNQANASKLYVSELGRGRVLGHDTFRVE
jgi:hypothetical protein